MKFDNFGVYINRSQHKKNGMQYKICHNTVINLQESSADKFTSLHSFSSKPIKCYKNKEMVNSIRPSSSMI